MRRRRRSSQNETGVTLFPFMAVLICTMGTLVVLLVIGVRQAKVRADTVAREHVEQRELTNSERRADVEQLRIERETALWRLEQLQQSRKKTAEQLAEQRLQLSHIEDHTRRLEDEVKRLAQDKRALDVASRQRKLNHDDTRAELDELRQRVEEERAALADAQQQAAQRPRSYAIIPYDGPHGTRRRPIYIECLSDRVVLQPEGIVLQGADFRDPLGPGNPLAASLRAIREYWARNSGSGTENDAYPLLVVRSGGAEAYVACRQAMKSWDDEFGYELVSDELQLAYPPRDPALTSLLERTVRDARVQNQRLMMAALAQPGAGGGQRAYLRADSASGGFVVAGDASGRGGPGTGRDQEVSTPWQESTAGSAGGPSGQGGFYREDGWPSGSAGGGDYGGASPGGLSPGGSSPGGSSPGGSSPGGSSPGGSSPGGSSPGGSSPGDSRFERATPGSGNLARAVGPEAVGPPTGDGLAGGSETGASSDHGHAPSGQGDVSGGTELRGGDPSATISRTGDYVPSRRGGVPQGAYGVPPNGSHTASGPGRSEMSGGDPSRSPPAAAGSSGFASSPAGRTPATEGMSPSNQGAAGRESRPNDRQYFGGSAASSGGSGTGECEPNLAAARGRDWALPNAAQGATGVNRPIRVLCAADVLSIVPQQGSGQRFKVVAFEGSAVASVDKFVSTLWQHIEEWGIAGPGMYWKPVLRVEVAPGGQTRFAQLSQLLDGSGIQVEQKTR